MLARSAVAALVLGCALLAGGCKCSSGATLSASPAPAESVAPLKALAASLASSTNGARKTAADLVPPPLVPPADAKREANGLSYQIQKLAAGEPVNPNDSIRAELSVWSSAGKLAYSTYQGRGPAAITRAFVPPALSALMQRLPAGSKAWLWLPAPLVHALLQERPSLPFPDTAIVLEYEPVEIEQRPVVAASPAASASAAAEPASERFPAPDAAGPPKDALVAASGLRYVVLSAGAGDVKPKPGDKLGLRLTLWPVTGLVVEAPLLSQQASATTLARAPASLAPLLQTLTLGSVVRVWLPAGKAQQVGPVPAGREAVLDLSLERIE